MSPFVLVCAAAAATIRYGDLDHLIDGGGLNVKALVSICFQVSVRPGNNNSCFFELTPVADEITIKQTFSP